MMQRVAYIITFALILLTPFIYSDNLYNGVISAKQIWFYGTMALLIFLFGIDILFHRKRLSLSFNKTDIVLLAFYIYLFARSAFSLYTPLLYNTRFINYTLLSLLYFIVKSVISTETSAHYPGPSIFTRNQRVSYIDLLSIGLMLTGLVQALWGMLQLYGLTRSFHCKNRSN
jgi:hypothetical protein